MIAPLPQSTRHLFSSYSRPKNTFLDSEWHNNFRQNRFSKSSRFKFLH